MKQQIKYLLPTQISELFLPKDVEIKNYAAAARFNEIVKQVSTRPIFLRMMSGFELPTTDH